MQYEHRVGSTTRRPFVKIKDGCQEGVPIRLSRVFLPLFFARTNMANSMLRRDISLAGAILLGLGSIVGTGAFVSIGLAAGIVGKLLPLAIFCASLLAVCNGLSSAQLAANHPVSGGTYEYGYRWLNPWLGYLAGCSFLLAKSASAATAAVGLAIYLGHWLPGSIVTEWSLTTVALVILIVVTAATLVGFRGVDCWVAPG